MAKAVHEITNLASALARYHAGVLRVVGAQNAALRNVRTAAKAVAAS